MFERSKLRSLHDLSLTIIGDTLSYGLLQTDRSPSDFFKHHYVLAKCFTRDSATFGRN